MSPLRLRLTTATFVALALLASHLALPDGDARSRAQYLFVITLGYGHLLGAALLRAAARSPWSTRSFWATTLASGFVLYAEAVAAWPGVVLAFAALSVWHIAENDAALARALARGTRIAAPARGLGGALPIATAGLVGAAALAAAEWPGLLGDLFAAATLYHLVAWLLFAHARGTSLRRLVALHAPPAALCAGLLAWPAPEAARLREWLFSPAVYLYASSLHVFHTVWLRRGSVASALPAPVP